jgi:3-hydroxy-9,10-secoandrosta-1,3,5(10)-triene-9,17-dione monooxygenase reductase component
MSIDSARFRKVLSHVPTPVTVVTAMGPEGPVGLTIGSFTSVSLDPPLVGFLPGKKSDSWPLLEQAGHFCVNILAEDQGELCWRFATELPDKFEGVEWTESSHTGAPLLEGIAGWIDCTIHSVSDAGDHFWVMGLVEELQATHRPPMVFCDGRVGGVAPE